MGGVWLFLIGVAATVVQASGWTTGLRYLPLLLAIGYLAWLVFWRPRVRVGDDGVTIVNPFRTVAVPWRALVDVRTRHSLTLVTPHARYTAWSAPSTRPTRRSEAVAADAGQQVLRAWRALVESESLELGVADTTPVAARWDASTLLVLAGLLVTGIGGALA
jgi:hypothetical protein